MPKLVTEVKAFIQLTKRPDTQWVKMTKSRKNKGKKADQTKFKVRCSKYLYTYIAANQAQADKLKETLPDTLIKTRTKAE